MSYILDALRRADAERERGAVPGLRSQQHTIAEDDAAAPRRQPLVWAVVALGVALVGALAWNFLGGPSPAPRAPAVEGSVGPVPAPLPTLNAAPTPVAPAQIGAAGTTPAAPPPIGMPPAVRPPPATESAAPTPAAPVRKAASSPRTAPEQRRTAATPAREPGMAAPVAATAAAASGSKDARVYAPSELPEEIRRELPKVVIGGSSYSGDPKSRMVMISGQVFHEGDRLAPGLVLEKIQRKSAVLAYKGWRYELAF